MDNPNRDLPGLVLLATTLAQRGIQAFLVPMNRRESEVWALQPDLVLLNYLRPKYVAFAQKLAKAGIVYGVLDTEGGVFPSVERFTQTVATQRDVLDGVSFYCVWGSTIADLLVERGYVSEDRVSITGSPRIDFYTEPLRSIVADRLKVPGDPMVMINGNFPLANPAFATPKEEADALVAQHGFSRPSADELQDTQRRCMSGLVEVANALASRFPEVTFVYRPHPFERLSTYDGLLDARKNLRLDCTGSVDPWILRSRAVIQRSCSTGVEAAMAGVPALSPSWLPSIGMPAADTVSVPCTTMEELEAQVRRAVSSEPHQTGEITDTLRCVIEDWFFKLDGAAHERVADVIERNLPAHRQVSERECRRHLHNLDRPAQLRRRFARHLRYRLHLSPHLSLRSWSVPQDDAWFRSGKYFSADEVRYLVRAFATLDSGSEPEVCVSYARDSGDYCCGIRGQSVTVSPPRAPRFRRQAR